MSQVEVKRKQIQAVLSILGAVTWLVLGRLIGYNGIAYLGAAVEGFCLFELLLADKVPDALGRLVRSRNLKGQFKNAAKIRSSILISQSALGALGGVLLFFLAQPLAENVFRMPYGMLALRILAPALVLRVITGIFLGYFQGNGNQMPTVVVYVLRHLMYLGLGVLFVGLFQEYGEKVKLLLLNDSLPSMYGAAGMATAVAVTESFMLIFAVLIYAGSRRSRKNQEEGLKRTEDFGSAVGGFYGMMAPSVLIAVLFRMPIWLGLILYQRNVADIYLSAWDWGKYYGGYLVLCSIPVLLGQALLHPLAARTAAMVKKGEMHYAGKLLGAAFHWGLTYPLLISVFLATMATQVSCTLAVSGEESQLVAEMLRCGSTIVFLAILVSMLVWVLMYMGKTNLVIGGGGIYVIVFAVITTFVFRLPEPGIKGLVYAGIAALAALALLFTIYMFKAFRVKIDFISWFGIPVAAALCCGIICYLLSAHATKYLGYGVTMLLGLVISAVVYTLILLFFRSFGKQELEVIPGGKILNLLKTTLNIV